MLTAGTVAKWGLGLYAAREAFDAFVTRRRARRDGYAQAETLARRTGTPLLVIGDPDTGFITKHFGRDYGCGDVCTDTTGCPLCGTRITGRLEDVLPRLPSRSHVIFESLTLEYVDDLPLVQREIARVMIPGGFFTAGRIEPGSSTHWLHSPPTKWVRVAGEWRRR